MDVMSVQDDVNEQVRRLTNAQVIPVVYQQLGHMDFVSGVLCVCVCVLECSVQCRLGCSVQCACRKHRACVGAGRGKGVPEARHGCGRERQLGWLLKGGGCSCDTVRSLILHAHM